MQDYLIKFSLSLALLFIFYYVILRPLTFYQWNRACLLVYSILCFIIPFINITPWIKKPGIEDNVVLNSIPIITLNSVQDGNFFLPLSITNIVLLIFFIGVAIMSLRFIIRYISLGKVRKNANLLSTYKDVNLYNVSENISPFSFGQSIFVNKEMHNEEELQRIIQHEFVHVKQKHTIDLMLAEIICIVNWLNPFAWLIRSAIRQNLEFIADEKVVSNGIDKKEYQYLLLKVIGASAYGLANHLNFYNLKKRITMMNKMKSTRLHLTKFLFALPLFAVILLAFRQGADIMKAEDLMTAAPIYIESKIEVERVLPISIKADTVPKKKTVKKIIGQNDQLKTVTGSEIDSVPKFIVKLSFPTNKVNEKGYIITSAISQGDTVIIVKDKNKKIIESVYLTDWDKDKEFEEKYGQERVNFVIKNIKNDKELLYVVDGVIKETNPLNTIFQDDVESFTILKDKLAKLIYGERAVNGVIVVKLKKK